MRELDRQTILKILNSLMVAKQNPDGSATLEISSDQLRNIQRGASTLEISLMEESVKAKGGLIIDLDPGASSLCSHSISVQMGPSAPSSWCPLCGAIVTRSAAVAENLAKQLAGSGITTSVKRGSVLDMTTQANVALYSVNPENRQ